MPLKHYGVLKCRAVAGKTEMNDSSPHYQVHVKDNQQSYRIALNVRSVQAPFDLLYCVDSNFKHPITEGLTKLEFGFHSLPPKAGSLALDYIRGNLFDVTKMKPLPYDLPGPDNDLNELIDLYIQRAISSNEAALYAFGEPWGPENKADKIFGFRPGNGIHDIHMNQGSSGKFQKDNGIYQDGGLIIHFPQRNQWVAAFFAFQSQSIHTDDVKGNPLPGVPGQPVPTVPVPPSENVPLPDKQVRIVAALLNPSGDDVGKETVTLINTCPETIDLNGWAIADSLKRKRLLKDIILAPGGVVTVPLTGQDIQLSNAGGIISLLNKDGVKIDGVSYTKEDAKKQGWTIVF